MCVCVYTHTTYTPTPICVCVCVTPTHTHINIYVFSGDGTRPEESGAGSRSPTCLVLSPRCAFMHTHTHTHTYIHTYKHTCIHTHTHTHTGVRSRKGDLHEIGANLAAANEAYEALEDWLRLPGMSLICHTSHICQVVSRTRGL